MSLPTDASVFSHVFWENFRKLLNQQTFKFLQREIHTVKISAFGSQHIPQGALKIQQGPRGTDTRLPLSRYAHSPHVCRARDSHRSACVAMAQGTASTHKDLHDFCCPPEEHAALAGACHTDDT